MPVAFRPTLKPVAFAVALALLYVFKAKTTILWVVLAAAGTGLALFG